VTDILGEIKLVRVADGASVQAQICLGLEERHLRDHELAWRPPMLKAARDAQARCTKAGSVDMPMFRAECAKLRVEDFNWDWRRINAVYKSDSDYALLAIECEGHAQGLMLIETVNHATRLSPKGEPLAYVELLTSAPWNRGTFITTQQFNFTGYALVATAISFSQKKNFAGRVALHSVSGALSFYAGKCGMSSLGADPMKKGLEYFEMSSQQADTFLAKISARRGAP
jgi:hypothetical protein